MNRLHGILLGFAVAAGCGGPQEPGVYGEECFRDDDCQPGLVCVGVESASDRICTNEVNGLVAMVPGPTAPVAEGGAPAGGMGGAPDLGGAPADGGAGIVAGTGGTAGSGGTGGSAGNGGSSGGGSSGSAGTAGTGGTPPLAGAGGA